jgi:hypothetical protein
MNVVFKLVADYLNRTLGVWLLAWFLHTMQAATLFARQDDHVPILGAMIAAIAFFATFESPQAVLRTLPVSQRDLALTRWWASIGWPAIFSAFCIVGGWLANVGWGFPRPPASELWFPILVCWSVLAILSALPMPMLSHRRQGQLPTFTLVWGALTILPMRQLQGFILPTPVLFIVVACAIGLAGASYAQAERGHVLAVSLRSFPGRRRLWRRSGGAADRSSTLRGWSVLLLQMAKSTAMLTIGSVAGITFLRWIVPALDRSQEIALGLAVGYVSVTGVVSAFIVRRWLGAFRMLQVLPIRDSSLALVTWASLMAPAFLACVVASGIHSEVPSWGLHIPYFMYPLFAIVPLFFVPASVESSAGAPATVQQWSPVIQIALWPVWAGAFSSLALTKLMPTWFDALAVGATIVFAGVGYWLVYLRVRSGAGLERTAGPLATR